MQALSDMILLCQVVQAPVKPEKVLGLSTTLGILLDTNAGEARLPADKLSDLQQDRASHLPHSSRYPSHLHKAAVIIGKLAFTCKVIPAGRIFLRRLLDTTHSVDQLEHKFTLTTKLSKTSFGGSDSPVRGMAKVFFSNLIGRPHTACTSIPTPPAKSALEHTGLGHGSVTTGRNTCRANP